ncbi:Gfo/Idh/MocA family oxidoreductase [Pontibacter brevis]
MPNIKNAINRRNFIKATATGALTTSLGINGFPTIVPASVLGKNAPSNRINVGAIGTGRISLGHDMPGVMQYDTAKITAVCDVDSKRAEAGKNFVNNYYTKKNGKPYDGVKVYTDFRELLQNKDIDAVIISTPDHWHAPIAILAAEAGKDIYMQKPASLTISEGRAMSNAVHRTGRILQIGSQQRSSPQFRYAAELVRNGRIGQLKTVYIGLPGDPGGNEEPAMPIPANLNYDMWLGTTPYVYYTENRVHPQNSIEARPGWLRCEQFGAGMITGWGSHHIDSAHWAMDTEYTGPIEVKGWAEYPTSGLWDVHGKFQTEALYANGVKMIVNNEFENGIKFEGTEGWIFVTRGDYAATASDPVKQKGTKALTASNNKIITSVIGPNEIHLIDSKEHHGNWLESIKSRNPPIAPVEVGHRSCSACLIHQIAMKLKRTVYWDPIKERFRNDDEANSMLSRPQRSPWAIS